MIQDAATRQTSGKQLYTTTRSKENGFYAACRSFCSDGIFLWSNFIYCGIILFPVGFHSYLCLSLCFLFGRDLKCVIVFDPPCIRAAGVCTFPLPVLSDSWSSLFLLVKYGIRVFRVHMWPPTFLASLRQSGLVVLDLPSVRCPLLDTWPWTRSPT